MQLSEAIDHLAEDLRRYAQHPKANHRAVAFRKAVLNTVIDAINERDREIARLRKDCAREREGSLQHQERLHHLRQWCRVNDVDLAEWDRLPDSWKSEYLDTAVSVADVLRYVDGIVDRYGMRTGRAYRNQRAFAYSVISSVAQEPTARFALRKLGLAEPPQDLPLLLWNDTTTTTTT